MKRKTPADPPPPESQRSRRQPQTSCLNCRLKKLKCDRGTPCSSCHVRGITCTGQPGAAPAPMVPQYNTNVSIPDVSILSRLDKLEKAVFGAGNRHGPNQDLVSARVKPNSTSPSYPAPNSTTTPPSPAQYQDTERQQTVAFLDRTYTKNVHHVATTRYDRLSFQIAPASSHYALLSHDVSLRKHLSRKALIMTQQEALELLRDFLDNPFHLMPIIYEPAARNMINNFYSQLAQGRDVDPSTAALILSIASCSASFYNQNSAIYHYFTTTDEATDVSISWRDSALLILDDPDRPLSESLEEVQARAMIAYTVLNVEGCSARFRLLHASEIAVARDMSLHLVDSAARQDASDDCITREIKRRLWWHIASTDWLLGMVGGPLDGTYSVQARHCNVKRPRNLNDSDLKEHEETLTYPANTPTEMSTFIQRIRLSEIVRDAIDARDPWCPDIEITDFDTVTSLDRLFEQALADMPPFQKRTGPIPAGAPALFAQQRDMLILAFHARRARLHRTFLINNSDDPRCEPARQQCVTSARTTLAIAIELLEGTNATEHSQGTQNPLAYRVGLIISSMFMACAILAIHAGLTGTHTSPGGTVVHLGDAASTEFQDEMSAKISRATRALTQAGEKSSFAATLVRNLVRLVFKCFFLALFLLLAFTLSSPDCVFLVYAI
ncbi:hypothetical protein GGR57DRAFT_184646 [Xylariaceae sp. FL1272]|nr:hypothetical protein GGR57DRAFT_184646 [Xylariaceae sp. FL1272]